MTGSETTKCASPQAQTASEGQGLRVEPRNPFPVQALSEFVQSPRFQKFNLWISEGGENLLLTTARNPRLQGSGSDLYQFQLNRYNVLVMSPILEWYLDERETIQALKKEAKRQKTSQGAFDAGRLKWDWSKYEGKIQGVVRVVAVPDFCQTTLSFLLSGVLKEVTQLKYKTSFSEMSLLCDGKEIQPVDCKDFEVKLPDGYGTPAGAYAMAGNCEYPIEAFDQNSCRQLALRITSRGNLNPSEKVVPSRIVRRVWADFEGVRNLGKGDMRNP